MFRGRFFLLYFLAVAVPAAAQQQSVGIFGLWGTFARAGQCYAISEPQKSLRAGAGRPFVTVGYWPGRGVRGQVHFRLAEAKRAGSAVLLRIDERTFQLAAGGAEAWAPDPRADAAIVTAMRTGLDMSVETRSARGAPIRDSYRLRGAATAIDAAAIACARRG
jgi:hypothetical protein